MSSTPPKEHSCVFCERRYSGTIICPHCKGSRITSVLEKLSLWYFLLVLAGFVYLDVFSGIEYESMLLHEIEDFFMSFDFIRNFPDNH